MTKNTIDRQYTEGVELYCQLLLENISYLREVVIEGWRLFEEKNILYHLTIEHFDFHFKVKSTELNFQGFHICI